MVRVVMSNGGEEGESDEGATEEPRRKKSNSK